MIVLAGLLRCISVKSTSTALHKVLLLALLLLIGQTAVVLHQSHENGHPPGELCGLCLHATSLGSPAHSSVTGLVSVIPAHPLRFLQPYTALLSTDVAVYPARAPPVFS